MRFQFQLRRGSTAEWVAQNPVLHEGEPGVELDTSKLKIGDGVTAWNALGYIGGSGGGGGGPIHGDGDPTGVTDADPGTFYYNDLWTPGKGHPMWLKIGADISAWAPVMGLGTNGVLPDGNGYDVILGEDARNNTNPDGSSGDRGLYSVIIGWDADGMGGYRTILVGDSSQGGGFGSIGIGAATKAKSQRGVSVGLNANSGDAGDTANVAIGADAHTEAGSSQAVTVGANSSSADNGVAVGQAANSSGLGSVSIGHNAAGSNGSIAIGENATSEEGEAVLGDVGINRFKLGGRLVFDFNTSQGGGWEYPGGTPSRLSLTDDATPEEVRAVVIALVTDLLMVHGVLVPVA